jgi:hypothetical protein
MELFYAYIDPGSGSLVVQALIAGLVAIPVLFRRQIARVVRTLRRSEEPPSRDISDPDDTAGGT